METEYIKLISELDGVLSGLRDLWMNAATDSDKTKWRVRIDEMLDERLRLMRCRDAAKSQAA